MKKDILIVDQIKVSVNFLHKIIQIDNNQEFNRLMQSIPNRGIVELNAAVKAMYFSIHGESINVSDRSLIVEIWGHYYFERILIRIRPILKTLSLSSIKIRLLKATEVFDCGERPIDKNRWIWDLVSKAYPIISKIIKDKP